MALMVRVITPDKIVWEKEAQEVILPSSTGQLGILTNHAPLLTSLDIGVMRIRPDREWKNIAVMGGFAEVENNEVKVLVNDAELGDNINREEAEAEYQEAQKAFDEAVASGDRRARIKATQRLKKARARFQAAS
ncbi:MAG: ATP synthase F1 subunit epsilon [Geminocystis sp.]|nr:ATP synthase F1 subunit epsilon [Geminocystis sp.]HIK37662.1 F0F1 ATP synthase subunit epsilon [Geminocystis sp. M7585_C2015_104]MCS7148782.1 ATP synthase F1 subunit epsilon [Geminocystis sp.]MCX8078684.1 ATP synthase F1 subunit epsilon [Geminocystis sp.]MDW8115380.1 ATP synthase F1 subunit epsilon [Geminocystis sp.]